MGTARGPSLSLTYSQASLCYAPHGGGVRCVTPPACGSVSVEGPLSVQPRPPLLLPAHVRVSRQQGVGVCHLTITDQPGRVGTSMTCLLAAGTRLAASRGGGLLRNLVPPSPGGCFSASLGSDGGGVAAPHPAMPWGPGHSLIQPFEEFVHRRQPTNAVL